MRSSTTLIIGGGPAGAATAIGLARAGLAPLILERERKTRDALCGGFMSWTALPSLELLGLDVWNLGARRITQMRLFAQGREARTELPAPAASLSRKVLDTALLARAEALGAGVERGVKVRTLDEAGAQLADGARLIGDTVVLATGKHELRGHPRDGDLSDPVLGLRWRLGASASLEAMLDGAIELHGFRGGYAGLALQEDGRANLCLAVRDSRFAQAGKNPAALLQALAEEVPSLAARVDRATQISEAAAIAHVPYGWRFAASGTSQFYRVGDQAGVIASLSGEGISLALASGMAAASAIVTRQGVGRFQAGWKLRLDRPVSIAQRLMQGIEQPATAWLMARAAAFLPSLMRVSARSMRVAQGTV